MKATALLEKQHREVSDLFTQLSAGPPNEGLIEELSTVLTAHATIEEELFYPAAKRFKKDMILSSLEEHDLMAHALKRVFHTDPTRESFHARLKATKEVVERHVKEEETELLPAMAEALGAEEDEALGARMKARFEELTDMGYVRAVAERKARRSHDSDRPTPVMGAAPSMSHEEEKATARPTSERSTGNHKGSTKKKSSHAHPRGA